MISSQQPNPLLASNEIQKVRLTRKPSRKLPLPLVASLILTVITVVLAIVTILWQSNSLISQQQDTRSDASAGNCTITVGSGSGEVSTIQAAVSSLKGSVAGKTICVRNNKVYDFTEIKGVSGTANSPLVIKAHPNNTGSNKRPQIKDASTPLESSTMYRGALRVVDSKNLVIESLEVSSSPAIGINVGGSENITLRDMVIHDMYTSATRFINSKNITLDGCQIYNYEKAINIGSEAMLIVNSKNSTIQNCKLWDNVSKHGGGGVLAVLRSDNVTYRNNEVHAPFVGSALHHDQSRYATFENNVIVGYCKVSAGGGGASIFDEPYPERQGGTGPWRKQYSENITVRNNLIITTERISGINLGGCQRKAGEGPGGPNYMDGDCVAKNITVENNTVVGTGTPAFSYRNGNYTLPPQGISIKNNIFYSASEIARGNPGSQYFSGNIWSSTPFGSKPAGDTVVNNLSGVFASGINPNSCISSLNLNDYKVSSAYAGKGADISKVGVKKSGEIVIAPPNPITPDSTSIPTPRPTPTPTPVPTPTFTPIASPKPPTDPIETPIPTSPPSNTTITPNNLIQNGSFSPNPYWSVGLGGRLIMEGGAGRYTITNNKEFNQLLQSGITLQSGKTYRVKFSAKSSIATKISVGMIKHTSPFTNYATQNSSMKNLALTTQWKNFSTTFVAGNFSGVVSDARFRFEMNNYANNTDFWFKDVVMEEM